MSKKNADTVDREIALRRLLDDYLEHLDETHERLSGIPYLSQVRDIRKCLNANARMAYGILLSFLENENKQLKYFYSDVSVVLKKDNHSLEHVYLVRGKTQCEVTEIRLVALKDKRDISRIKNAPWFHNFYLIGDLYRNLEDFYESISYDLASEEWLTDWFTDSSSDDDREYVFQTFDDHILMIMSSLIEAVQTEDINRDNPYPVIADLIEQLKGSPADVISKTKTGISRTEITPLDISIRICSSVRIDESRIRYSNFITLNEYGRELIDSFIETTFLTLAHGIEVEDVSNARGVLKVSDFNDKLLKEAQEMYPELLPLIKKAVKTHHISFRIRRKQNER